MEEKRRISDKFKEIFVGEDWVDTTKRALWYLFLVAFLGVYTVITDDKYFNITRTRYEFFMFIAVMYSMLFFVLWIVGEVYKKMYHIRTSAITTSTEKWYKRPEFWMEAFMLANIYSCLISVSKRANPDGELSIWEQHPSIAGQDARLMGLLTYMVIGILFLVIASGVKLHTWIFMVFSLSSLYAYVIAIFQHAGNDFMGYRERVSTPKIFISTFGNINIFASFLTMSVPIFICIFIFSKNKIYKAVTAIMTVLGAMCLLASNSDSAFLGVAAAMVMIFIFAFKDGKAYEFVKTILMLAIGVMIQVFVNDAIGYKNNRGGIAEAIQNPVLVVVLVLVILIICVTMKMLITKKKDYFEELDRKKIIKYMLITMTVCLVGIVVLFIVKMYPEFKFERKWGNYRGMIWNICIDIFDKAPMVNKVFGHGNETLRILTVDGYYDEMIKYTKRVYDNAHNELLQYLVTLGLAGTISYLGLVISTFVYIIKNAAKRIVPYICLAAMTGYFVQSLVNLNQPITTPYFFLFMAIGIGYIKESKKTEVQGD